MKPETKYTKSGHVNIAYQVFGTGAIDLVYIPGWVSNIDSMWLCPELVNFLEELGKISRVILFDKRGTGLSDRIVAFPTLEERMDDIRAVMDAVGSEKAVLFGHSEGGSVSALFSATYPNRVLSLITFGIFAKRRYSDDYPWAPTDSERQKVYDMIENRWGGGEMNLETLAPSKAQDKQFMDWLASYFRCGASPRAALKLTTMNTEVNIIDILKYIKVPTLIMQRTHDVDVKIEEGKFINQHIENSKFVEFDGADHLFWVGNTQEILEEMKVFIKNIKPNHRYKNRLFTVLFGKMISAIKSGFNFEMIHQCISKHEGSIVHLNKTCFVATFEVPGKAVHCSLDIKKALQDIESSASMGIYMKEGVQNDIEVLNDHDDRIIKSMLSQINPDQILVTQTVKHLLSGAGFDFIKSSSVLDTASHKLFKLYSVTKKIQQHGQNEINTSGNSSHYDSFLENVLHIIDQYLDSDTFSVEMLSRKMGISERQLQRRIKATTRKSPNQLITSTRLNKAKEALMSYNYTVAEVAFQFGFSSPSYFSKCFKKEFGIQPTSVQQQKPKNKIEDFHFIMS